ncbi:MAG: dephospho-CoA kinase [Candidatus Aenigmarchaeota archaeon]|nr:dephospho-CoA kinase [Candidatus Aenigmarchaeota archaeon]MDI6737321.1 dephospho-CoA kinase [Nanoarchaeota archaeon]
MLIGLTGNIATGKSAAASFFKALGAKVIDADRIVHELYDKNARIKLKILFAFGLSSIDFCRLSVNRHRLAKIVFSGKSKMQKLESIVWPYVDKEIARLVKSNGITIVEAALLFESGMDKKMNKTIMVCADKEVQLRRILQRNRELSKEEALKRINIQLSQKEKAKKAEYVINNNSSLNNLEKEVKKVWKKLSIESH